jgi:superfamily II DNA/RNA helicase
MDNYFSSLQIVDVCEEYQKEAKLARLLEEIGCQQGSKIIIFVETKRKADELTRYVNMRQVFFIRYVFHSFDTFLTIR